MIQKVSKHREHQQPLGTNSLVDLLSRHLKEIVKGRPILLAYLYGSIAKGNSTPFSDVDIALIVNPDMASIERLRLMLRIATELEEKCNLSNIDVRIINNMPLVFRGRVVCDGILLYSCDERTRIHFETTTRSEYFDYLPVHLKLQDAFFKDICKRGLHG